MKKILLLDSHAVLHRSYHAMANMITTEGLYSGAVFGFLKSILLSEKIISPDYIFACYDLPKPTFRHLAFDNYKGHRKETDSQLVEQINNSKKICESIGIQTLSKEGYEADDVIGSIAERYGKEYEVYILTSDMDIMQLIKDNVRVLYLKSLNESKIIDRASVYEKYKIYPENIPDYKGLIGDTSDNIQGVIGIGEKTGLKIISAEPNLERLYGRLKDEVEKNKLIEILGEKLVNKLIDNEEEAMFSKTLATIWTKLEVDLKLSDNDKWRANINNQEYQH
ncbi:MAG: 5'-3' exonuclease H3TH domain-containing protein [Cyanobium sp. MAG06]|nr:5'-3' exonuclease H3TH domain-containing protein [Cyanobium sp. MAG06]